MDFTRVPAGPVTLSDRRTRTSWDVDVAEFDLAVCPVTRAQYAETLGEGTGAATDRDLPVDSVSWPDALEFCNALSAREDLCPAYALDGGDAVWDPAADGYRLPTEAEWERACRAGTTGPRYGNLDDIAWYRGNSGERPHPVGRKAPNGWGLHDMLGNVWEWTWDIYDPEVYGSYRVLRGGGWFDEHWSCRASVRRRTHPDLRIEDLGFRVARSVRAVSR
ncbi:formylglycine-generating enzyme family protein [Salininema proteolyticum]|uniref:Formylglycine-generating enzyme family protein n=1 Tax=Salininema proteolyticum TaxID=1607685 RepID=A0ABV8TUG1_9ACTN